MSDSSSDSSGSSHEDSSSSSSNDEEVVEEEVNEEVFKKPYKGYKCEKCGYVTKSSNAFIYHVTRKVPCYVVKDYNYGVKKAQECYEKKSKIVLEMLESLENNAEVNLDKLSKYILQIERLGRVHPKYKQEDVDEIKEIIKENQKFINI